MPLAKFRVQRNAKGLFLSENLDFWRNKYSNLCSQPKEWDLLDVLKKQRLFWKLKYEGTDRSIWRTRFGRDYGPNSRPQTTEKNVS
jgi:hypothetical protein